MANQTVKTRILIISDTHCAALRKTNANDELPTPPFEAPLPAADVLIHCGDLTHTGQIEQYEETLNMLKEIRAPVKLVIAGNHDLTLDRNFMTTHLEPDYRLTGKYTAERAEKTWQEARELWTSPFGRAKQEGITFLDEGRHCIDLQNGARINLYASPYTPEFYDWGFPYERDEDRFNSSEASLSDTKNITRMPIPSHSSKGGETIDILITHGPPYGQGDQTDRGDYAGCPHLLRAVMRSRPLLHCFGHIHEGWGAQIVRWSDRVDEVVSHPTNIFDWKSAWEAGVAHNGLTSVSVDQEKCKQRHAAFLDISRDGRQLHRGKETALVNAAIMDVKYQPVNAPWLVDIELSKVK